MERKWGNDNLGGVAWKASAIHDKDGSVGGIPNSYILINDGVFDSIAADPESCEFKPDWNAAVCRGDIGRLTFGGGGGPPRGGGAGPGAAPARGGGAGPGAAPARGAAAGPGAAAGGAVVPITVPARGPGAAAQPPVVLSRNGREYTVTQSNVRAGTEIKVTTERPSLNLTLNEMDSGSWVIFELPEFTTAAAGSAVDSLDALRKASDTSYYKGRDALWVKVVSNGVGARGPIGGGPGSGTSLQVSR
jgi:cell migration-inducing and hyaluronan-binding protein